MTTIEVVEVAKLVRFICCTQPIKTPKRDEAGFIVCPMHGMRRYGYLTVRKRAFTSVPFNAEHPIIMCNDYGESHLERDQRFAKEVFDLNPDGSYGNWDEEGESA